MRGVKERFIKMQKLFPARDGDRPARWQQEKYRRWYWRRRDTMRRDQQGSEG
jgi:hypothetical protein